MSVTIGTSKAVLAALKICRKMKTWDQSRESVRMADDTHLESLIYARTAERLCAGSVCLVKTSLEDEFHPNAT